MLVYLKLLSINIPRILSGLLVRLELDSNMKNKLCCIVIFVISIGVLCSSYDEGKDSESNQGYLHYMLFLWTAGFAQLSLQSTTNNHYLQQLLASQGPDVEAKARCCINLTRIKEYIRYRIGVEGKKVLDGIVAAL